MSVNLRPYPKYNDSGDEWIGQVPAHWFLTNLGTISLRRSERNRPDLPLLSVLRERGVVLRSSLGENENHNFIPEDLSNYRVAHTGDLVVNKMKAWQGSVGIAPMDGIVSPAYFIFELHGISQRFAHRVLRSRVYADFFARSSDGVRIGQWDLDIDKMKRIPVVIPPDAEQDSIVHYLAHFDHIINRLIRAKRRLIELLNEQKQVIIHRAVTRGLDPRVRLKPSGIEWLGDEPEHWFETRLKHVAKVQTGITLGKNYGSSHLVTRPYLRVANVQDGYLDLSDIATVALPPEEVINTELRPGDVLMTEGGDIDKLGRGYIWRGEIQGCLHQNHIFAVRANHRNLLPEYLVLLMTSRHGRNYFELTAKKTTNLASTNSTTLKSFPIHLPDVEEQQRIIDHLADQTSRVDLAIDRSQDQIGLLREYRTRLIADVVTGKLDVRDIDLPAMEEAEVVEDLESLDETEADEIDDIEEPVDE